MNMEYRDTLSAFKQDNSVYIFSSRNYSWTFVDSLSIR